MTAWACFNQNKAIRDLQFNYWPASIHLKNAYSKKNVPATVQSFVLAINDGVDPKAQEAAEDITAAIALEQLAAIASGSDKATPAKKASSSAPTNQTPSAKKADNKKAEAAKAIVASPSAAIVVAVDSAKDDDVQILAVPAPVTKTKSANSSASPAAVAATAKGDKKKPSAAATLVSLTCFCSVVSIPLHTYFH